MDKGFENFKKDVLEGEPAKEKEKDLERVAEKGVSVAIEKIRSRFENESDRENNLDYHNSTHTKKVIERVLVILKELEKSDPGSVSERDFSLVKIVAAFHDTVQDWWEDDNGMRKRNIEKNEESSANEAGQFMKDAGVFEDEDVATVKDAIMVTIPGFNPGAGTVVQPNLEQESRPVIRATALADIGAAGMGGPDEFISEGNAIFREDNLDIERAINSEEAISDEDKERYRERMLKWTNGQLSFASGRKALLEEELGNLPNKAKEAIRSLFDEFDATINAVSNLIEKRKNLSFEKLLSEIGYGAFGQ